jgi:geranylgeranyl reductase family protein
MLESGRWDVAVVGAGPAGLAAARTAARAGARTVVLERFRHPRYKTCGGGLIGVSLAAVAGHIDVPVRDHVSRATFTLDGRREFTRRHDGHLLAMVSRDEFDDALRQAAVDAGAVLYERAHVRGVTQDERSATVRFADRDPLTAGVVIGADGSSGVTARHVGARFDQVDLGLELEIPVPARVRRAWLGRLLVDWGPIPGSYGWVFPKGDQLTVGVIATRGHADATRGYLRRFIDRLGLASFEPVHDSGHLTRCRSADSPLRSGRVLVAGDAAGLLEPWTREGISFALRSGAMAGSAAAAATASPDSFERELDRYVQSVRDSLVPEMDAGRRILAAFARYPRAFHAALASPPGWRSFTKFCLGEAAFAVTARRLPVRVALAVMGR